MACLSVAYNVRGVRVLVLLDGVLPRAASTGIAASLRLRLSLGRQSEVAAYALLLISVKQLNNIKIIIIV